MKKYLKYLAFLSIVAVSGFYGSSAEAKSLVDSLKHKVMNKIDQCNAGAGGSAKGLQVAEQCIDEPGKNPNFAKSYWKAHCNYGNPGGDGDETLCQNAFASLKAPVEFTGCNQDTVTAITGLDDPKAKVKANKMFVDICIADPKALAKVRAGDNQDETMLAALTDWYTAFCDAGTMAKADKANCAKVKKALPPQ